ncbi:glycosyltransferase family 2 protein [Patescibacteria group bacterium]
MKKLSIIIVNYNTKKLVLDCFDSIKKEGSKISLEVIVVDNASSDGSKEVFKKLEKENKEFILIDNKDNLGYAKANNQGIKISKGKYLLLLNSDTLVKKNALGNLVKFAEKTPDAGVVGSRLYNLDGSLQFSCYHFPTIKNAILEYFLGQKGLFEKFAPKGKKPVTVDALVGASFLITPKARKKVGVLDERYWAYFEDIDYCRQVWKNGLKVYYLPSSEIIHYHGASFKKASPDEAKRWRRLIPSSKIYHGVVKHCILNSIIWIGQKWQKLLGFLKRN